MIVLIAMAAAAATPDLVGCRQGECVWARPVSNVPVRTTRAGTLRKLVTMRGVSLHPDMPPEHYRPGLRIAWDKQPETRYVLCSRTRPALAFRDGPRWIAHALDLFSPAAYQYASVVTYLKACHGLDHRRPGAERAMRRLGYRPGTRSDQVEIDRPEQLFALPARRG